MAALRPLGVTALLAAAVPAGICGFAWAGDAARILPSGGEALVHDALADDDAAVLRLRYVVDGLGAGYGNDAEAVLADMAWLCARDAPARLAELAPDWSEVVITLMAEPVPFGETRPDVVQMFDAFTVEDGACSWSGA